LLFIEEAPTAGERQKRDRRETEERLQKARQQTADSRQQMRRSQADHEWDPRRGLQCRHEDGIEHRPEHPTTDVIQSTSMASAVTVMVMKVAIKVSQRPLYKKNAGHTCAHTYI
jgi:hypothetical protein